MNFIEIIFFLKNVFFLCFFLEAATEGMELLRFRHGIRVQIVPRYLDIRKPKKIVHGRV